MRKYHWAMASRSAGRALSLTIATFLVVALAVTGCSPPKYRYVTNSALGTYLKVPRGWAKFEQPELAEAEARALATITGNPPSVIDAAADQSTQWRVAFDSDVVPSPEHTVNIASRVGSLAPVADVRVISLNQDQHDKISLSDLRNLFINYDELKDKAAKEAASKPLTAPTVTSFRALAEEELAPGEGLRGMRLRFELRTDPPDPLTFLFDQTALLDAATSRVYILMVRAEEREYLNNVDELNEIVDSFTVKAKDS